MQGVWNVILRETFLRIWYDEENDTLALFRLGSHSDLFKD